MGTGSSKEPRSRAAGFFTSGFDIRISDFSNSKNPFGSGYAGLGISHLLSIFFFFLSDSSGR
jgi:hypothetical protein